MPAASGILNHDFWKGAAMVFGEFRDTGSDLAGDLPINLCRTAVRIGNHGRLAGICLFANFDIERKPAQHIDVVILAHARRPALPKDMLLVTAAGAYMNAHVFHQPKDWHADLLEHLEPF